MVCLRDVRWRATWHALFVVQMWTHNIFPTWRRMYIKDINGTLTKITHTKETMLHSMVNLNTALHQHDFLQLEFSRNAEEREEWLNRITWARDDKDDPIHVHGVKWKSIFFNYHIGWYVCPLHLDFSCAHESNLVWLLTSPWVEMLKLLLHICWVEFAANIWCKQLASEWLILFLHGISFPRQGKIIWSLDNLGLSLGFPLF